MYKNCIHAYFFRACRVACAIAISVFGIELRATAQATSKDLSFEVATVKPVLMDASHPFNPQHFGAHVTPAGASYWTMTVGNLIDYAYGIDPDQVKGPAWTTSDRFDIEAKFPEGADTKDDRKMLQTLLKDRFGLAFHIEKRESDVYLLVVGKGGEKLKPSLPDPATPDKGTQTVAFDQENWAQHWELSKMTMGELAERLSICMDSSFHKVVDDTGIKGSYQVTYDCPAPRPRLPLGTGSDGTPPPNPDDASLLTRSLDALGLKLEKRKMPIDVYVIDHVQRPSPN